MLVEVGIYGAYSDENGRYVIEDIPDGDYLVETDPVGYFPYSIPVNTALTSKHDVYLAPDPSECTNDGILIGVVIDAKTGQPLDGIAVFLSGQPGTITGSATG